jgi:hypothetical protein
MVCLGIGDSSGLAGQEVRLQPSNNEGPFEYMLAKYAKRAVPCASSPESVGPASEVCSLSLSLQDTGS